MVDTFRISDSGSLAPEVRSLYDAIPLTDRKFARDVWRYDFRLCISATNYYKCFSGDAKVGYANGASFGLSEDEEQSVLRLFRKLDSRANKEK
jgi:hypothetical protein